MKKRSLKSIQYVVIKDNDKMWLYLKLTFKNNQNTSYYHCTDTECKGRGYIRYSKNKKNQNEININDNENFIITKYRL